MRIRLVTPAAAGSRRGNRVTADRWAGLLRGLGHRVSVHQRYDGAPCDLLIALHARKSAAAIVRSRRDAPARPVFLALTGTDIYRDVERSALARRALVLADRMIVLQPLAARKVPPRLRSRVRVVRQSVPRSAGPVARKAPGFQVVVLGHLRAVKDPFRTARAVRRLPASSTVRVVHAGEALTLAMAAAARREEARNPRYRWLGDLPRAAAMRLVERSRLLVLSSRMEGGSNALGEAIARGVPVLASRIDGTVGLLGPHYPGYFPVGDTRALAALLARAESDPEFLARLTHAIRRLAPLFAPARERAAWTRLLREAARLGSARRTSRP